MANNYLITGYWGEPHVTAENDRGINAAIFGAGRLVLPVGERLRAEYIGNNTIRVYDGKLVDNGAAAGIPAGEYVDLVISNAGQGMKRNDLIVFQYEKDTSTLVESGTFVVVCGEETSGTASDPTLTQADLLSDKATFDQMALWRVPVSGATISAPVRVHSVFQNTAECIEITTEHIKDTTEHAQNKSNPHGVTLAQIGAAPAGYGLGTAAKKLTVSSMSDLDGIKANGWYWFNLPSMQQVSGVYMNYAYMRVECADATSVRQTIHVIDAYGSVLSRYRYDDKWSAWECHNPPMLLGEEYRTTERWKGKPVYVRAFDMGEFTSHKTLYYDYGDRVLGEVINCVAHAKFMGDDVYTGVNMQDEIMLLCNAHIGSLDNKLFITVEEINLSIAIEGVTSNTHAYAIVKYTIEE